MTVSIDHIGVYATDRRWDDIQQALDEADFSCITQSDISVILMELAFYGATELVEQLIAKGPDLNYRFDAPSKYAYHVGAYPGATALTQTICGSDDRHPTFETMALLLRNGADPNLIGYSSQTPLQKAIMYDRPEHAVLLLLYGANPYLPSIDINDPDAFDYASDHPWAKKMLERLKSEFGDKKGLKFCH